MVQPDRGSAPPIARFPQIAYPAIKNIIEASVTSGLIYLNSHADDFLEPELRPLSRPLSARLGWR